MDDYDDICHKHARKWAGLYDDLMQVGRLAAFRAEALFDPSFGRSKRAYVGQRIQSEITRVARQMIAPVGASVNARPKRDGDMHRLARLPGRSMDAEHGREDTYTLHDKLAAPELVEEPELPTDLLRAIEGLQPRLREIVGRRLQGETLKQIGDSWGVSRERVRQLEERAHGKLRRTCDGLKS